VEGSDLRGATTKSCGCIHKELNKGNGTRLQEGRKKTKIDGVVTCALKQHKKESKTSKYVGVYFDKKKSRWKATIAIKYKGFGLGTFHTEEEAHKARLIAEEFLFKPFLEKMEKKRFLIETIGFTDEEAEEMLREDSHLNKKIEKALGFIKAS
jgi:hypothetical protein